jgi:anti-anti-sigma factor
MRKTEVERMTTRHASHWLQREDLGNVTVARIQMSRLDDDDTTREMFHAISTLVDSMGRNKLVLNLANVKTMMTLGLGKLVMLNRKAEAAGGQLALCQLTPEVEMVVHAVHLEEILKICATEAEAVQVLASTNPEDAESRDAGAEE